MLTDWLEPRGATELTAAFAEELGPRWDAREQYRGELARVWQLDGHRLQAQRADRTRRLALALLDSFERTYQVGLRERLETFAAASNGGRITASEERRDRLSERARHFAKDWSSRPVRLHDDPDYEIVHLLTRDAQHYPGIRVVPVSERRVVPRGVDGESMLREIVGSVALLDANGEIRQREKSHRLAELRRDVDRTEGEEAELAGLMQELLRRDELRGVSGLESSFDQVLRGSNGYREQLGLEDVYGRGAESVWLTRVQDGADVRLTIVPELQRAARDVINRPTVPPDDKIDEDWFREPVGAIVLLDMDGRVLAAGSAPDSQAVLTGDEEGERARVVDRVFGASGFQPIGSVYKPFVALWALDRLAGYDEGYVNLCVPPPGKHWAEYEGLRCHSQVGHGPVNLPKALAVSCNPYFAHLADLIGPMGVAQVGYDFGLGQPTGVLELGEDLDVRRGLVDWKGDVFRWQSGMDLGLQVRRAANGLQVVQGSPAQVARAYLGLARGDLAPLRLVEAIGDEVLPPAAPRPLEYDPANVARVRDLLRAVTNSTEGSAFDQLSKERVGRFVVAKTGSADLEGRPDDGGRVHKHTWVAGWLPAEDPQLVFVVFVNDTVATSSHSATYVAEQILVHPAVQAWLEAHGSRFDPTPEHVRIATVDLSRVDDGTGGGLLR
ncbi:MAG: penicillin-binding transpeptidase domain-containing protein [Planctomycetota bacterium]